MQKKLFQFFLPQKGRVSGKNIEKQSQMPCPKLNMYIYIYIKFLQRIFGLPAIQCKW